MKKYKFRLQTVLEIRERKLETKLQELAEVMNILNKELEIEKELINKKNSLTSNIVMLNKISTAPERLEMQNSRDYWVHLGIKIHQQRERIKNVQQFVDYKQKEVSQAVKEKKILENLKEKDEKKFYDEYERQTRAELDDIAISRYKKAI